MGGPRVPLGDNAEWAKQTNFEHATHIPLMVSVPGLAAGVSHALVEEVDLFPTLVEAATMGSPGGPATPPGCPADTGRSRATALCTEGRSLVPLLANSSARWGRAAFSQFTRTGKCCDCPTPAGGACCVCPTIGEAGHKSDEPVMGYTVRVDKYRYTGWFAFNQTAALPDFGNVVATELYTHDEAPIPVDWAVEHVNAAADPAHKQIVATLHKVLVRCGQRPDLCPPELLEGLVP